ncbi:MAG TPA: creatininase family protein [Anaerolineaceae bacterium]|nr:creatininase family protein [Anaerolineaceae bacterium]
MNSMSAEMGNEGEDSVLYAELTPAEFRQRLADAPIAYLPLGTLEWHGEHLPLGADGLQAQGFFTQLARRAGGIVLPMLFLGPDAHQMTAGQEFFGMDIFGFPKGEPQQLDGSAYWIADEQFQSLVEAVLYQLARAGFKIVVAHGHGPSTKLFDQHRSEWSKRFGLDLFICWDTQNWDRETGLQTDHAAANETSLMMALHPEMVKMERLPAALSEPPKALLGEDPRLHASLEKGHKIIEKNLAWMEKVLRQALENRAGRSGNRT